MEPTWAEQGGVMRFAYLKISHRASQSGVCSALSGESFIGCSAFKNDFGISTQ